MLNALTRLASRCLAALRFRHVDRDFDQELASHLAMLEEENRQRGMTLDEARRAARLRLGGLPQLREAHRDERGLPLVDALVRDVRYGGRGLRRNPGFTALIILVLAIGIGANTAMFSVVHGVLLQPLDFPDPDRLMSVTRADGGWISLRRLESMRTVTQSFTGVGAFRTGGGQVTLSGDGEPEVLTAARVSANFLEILSVRPTLGRGFLAEEDTPGGPPVAIISANLWRRRVGADVAIAEHTLTLDSVPHTIVGVLPDTFRFPAADIDVWLTQPSQSPAVPAQYQACCTPLSGFARLRPGVSVEQAEAELDVLSERYATANPNARNLDVGPLTLVQWKAALTARVDTMLWMLLAAVGFVLLIGCANVATLLMARATSRSRELAVRAALGATRGRLIGQLLTESVMLSVAGGLLGLLVARIALGIVAQVTVVELPRAEEIRLDGVVLGFTAALSIAAGAFFGTLPALQVLRPDLMDRLRQSGVSDPRPSSVRGTRVSARGLLVVVQVALSMVLLVGAGLMMQTLARLASVDLGFYPAGLLTMQLPLAEARYDTPEKRAAFFDEVVQRVDGLPGVRGVALVRTLPTTGGLATNLQVEGQEIAEPGHMGMVLQTITPGAFRVLGVPLRRGREFTARDEAPGAPPVVIINESLARRVWPTDPADSNPIGRRLNVPFLTVGPLEIVGVVADVRQGGPKRDAPPQFYIPTVLNPPQFAHLVVRGEHDPLLSVPAIRAEVLVIDRDQPLADVRMMDEMLDASIGQQHAAARLLALFAGTALLLALVGIYGVLAYSVAQRTQEIAIRRTFGATRDDILGLVLRQAMRLTLIGVVCGLVGAATFTRLMETLLFEVSSTDLTTFGGVAVLFVMVALVASVVPALRAVRIDPATGLRI